MNTKWERRETKKQKGWYNKHLANNRKALEVSREAKRNVGAISKVLSRAIFIFAIILVAVS